MNLASSEVHQSRKSGFFPMLRSDSTSKRGERLGWLLMAAVGVGASLLVFLGNPGNMGICGACFLRDTAGSLNMFTGAGPRIFRPEVAGVILGAFFWVVLRRKYQARSGSFAVSRFLLGVIMGWTALVFLGCPFRMLQRIGGGDLHAVMGAIGFVAGVGVGLWFEKKGYSIGRTAVVAPAVGWVGPAVAAALLLAFLFGAGLAGPGPGAAGDPPHAFWVWSLVIASIAGAIMSATGFCAVTAARQVFLRQRAMLIGAGCLVVGYALISLMTGAWKFGWTGQPASQPETVWNIAAMAVVGLTGALAGGCPVRQMVLSGEGNGDAFVTVMGLLVGGATAHGLGIVSSGSGTTEAGRAVVILGGLAALLYAAAIVSASSKAARSS